MMNVVDLNDVKEGDGGGRYHLEESLRYLVSAGQASANPTDHISTPLDNKIKQKGYDIARPKNERCGIDSQYCDLVIDSPTTYLGPKTSC